MRELGNDVASVLAEVGARLEQVNDDAIRLEVHKQIRILKLASEELQDGLLGFHSLVISIFAKSGWFIM